MAAPLFATLFGLSRPVSARLYAAVGFSLMALKYGVDATVVYLSTGAFYSPFLYLSPILSSRTPGTLGSSYLPWLAVWTLPFLWIGLVLTLRRAIDAGLSPWLSLVYFVPIVNYALMLLLCFLPSRTVTPFPRATRTSSEAFVRSAVFGIASSLAITFAMFGLCVYVMQGYGSALFLGTPVVVGAVNAYLLNRPAQRPLSSTLGIVSLSVLLSGAALWLFALEGFVCILMAAPIAITGAVLGALVGRAIAFGGGTPPHQIVTVLCALPLLAGFESVRTESPRTEIISSIEIDAPPERVWPHVIGFTDLPPPSELAFRVGIAYPVRARIDGAGPGATRYCEFSTGSFVEPITRWEPPSRLSFDVRDQPFPLREWSIRPGIEPPHLDGYFRSVAGEFRLVPLAGGRTRLEGSTWYELDISPRDYWRLWADGLVHAIHVRVLEHIKRLAERSEVGPQGQRTR